MKNANQENFGENIERVLGLYCYKITSLDQRQYRDKGLALYIADPGLILVLHMVP